MMLAFLGLEPATAKYMGVKGLLGGAPPLGGLALLEGELVTLDWRLLTTLLSCWSEGSIMASLEV